MNREDIYEESDFFLVGIGIKAYEGAWDAELTIEVDIQGKSYRGQESVYVTFRFAH